jgi:myo-inositol-1(or 4)-monophosphatase
MNKILPTLSDLESMARGAGEILRVGYGQSHEIDFKGAINPVTEIDKRSEEYLLAAIGKQFPGQRVIAEETGGLPGDGQQVWYVDPLDGTVNYTHHIPIFSVSLAYEHEGELELGVVYDPIRDECFSAQRGRGAWLNGKTIKVTSTEKLADSLFVTGFPYDTWENPHNNLDQFGRFMLRSQGVRRLGSAALDLCYVAAGRFDGYWEIRLQPYDVAAGGLIVQEAGGLVTKIDNGVDFIAAPQSIVAANPVLHARMLEVLNG